MKVAARIAQRSPSRHKHGAILVSGGRLIAWGWNYNILDPYLYGSTADKLSIHAEESVLKNVDINGGRTYVLYVVRVNRRGDLMLSKPCSGCQSLIDSVDCVKKVIHT